LRVSNEQNSSYEGSHGEARSSRRDQSRNGELSALDAFRLTLKISFFAKVVVPILPLANATLKCAKQSSL
jgi:hypothetical protein